MQEPTKEPVDPKSFHFQKPQPVFCQVCRHPVGEDGEAIHQSWCPVLTGAAVPDLSRDLRGLGTIFQGYPPPQGVNPQDLQPMPRNMMGSLSFVSEDAYGYEVAKIYREARDRILEELKMQVEVNRQLSRELIDLRLEVDRLKAKEGA
jgi:hypothetical protein